MTTTSRDIDVTDEDEPTCAVITINPHVPNGRTIVMTHGAWHNATHYLRTLDDRPGWAYDFAEAGYRVVLADYPGSGASPTVADPTVIDAAYICRGLGRVIDSIEGPVDLLVHSMSGPYGVTLAESHGDKIAHLVAVAPGVPPEISAPPSLVEDLGDTVRVVYGQSERIFPKHGWTEGNLEFIAACIGPGSRFPAVDPEDYRATLSPLWAGLSIDIAHELVNPPTRNIDLSGRSVLVVCAALDPMVTPAICDRLVAWLVDHGADAELMDLDALGVGGNAHMMMLEDNSSEIAGMIIEWLDR